MPQLRLCLKLSLFFLSALLFAEPDATCDLSLRLKDDYILTGFKRPKTAVYESGEAEKVLADEQALLAAGFDVVVLMHPSASDLSLLTPEKKFFHGPSWTTWHLPVAEFKLRSDMGNKVRKSERKTESGPDIVAERMALTEASFKDFYRELYLPWVAGKETGLDMVGENFASPGGDADGHLDAYEIILFRDARAGGKLVGGNVLQRIPEESILKIKMAAFSKEEEYRKLYLSYRGFYMAWQSAQEQGLKTLSYGSDPNFYGTDLVVPGLQAFKASLGFRPLIWDRDTYEQTRIVKYLRPETLGQQRFMFSLGEIPPRGADYEIQAAEAWGLESGKYGAPAGVSVRWHTE
jgi:hypothetical protein